MDATTSPDPISEPKAYQDHLLGLLGDGRSRGGAGVRRGARGARWPSRRGSWASFARSPSEWSVIECLGHAVDAEVVMSGALPMDPRP